MTSANNEIPTVFADADVLWGSFTASVLMSLGTTDVVNLKWSRPVLDEVTRSVLESNPTARVEKRLDHMVRALPKATVQGFEHLIPNMPAHPKDRHVLAAAVHCGADVLISQNERHFHPRDAGLPIEVMHLDDFARALLMQNPNKTMEAITVMISGHRRNPRDLPEFVATAASRDQLRGFAIDLNQILPAAQRARHLGSTPPPLSPAARRFAAGRQASPRRRRGFER